MNMMKKIEISLYKSTNAKKFNMQDSKPNSLPLAARHNLDFRNTDTNNIISDISYAEAIESLMYAMIYTR